MELHIFLKETMKDTVVVLKDDDPQALTQTQILQQLKAQITMELAAFKEVLAQVKDNLSNIATDISVLAEKANNPEGLTPDQATELYNDLKALADQSLALADATPDEPIITPADPEPTPSPVDPVQ